MQDYSRLDPNGPAPTDGDEVTVLDAGDLHYSYKPGTRLTLGYQFDSATSLELVYLGMFDLTDSATVNDPASRLDQRLQWLLNGENAFFNQNDFGNSFRQTVKIENRLHSGEFNVRHQVSRIGWFTPTFVAGIRYLDIQDSLKFLSDDDRPAGDPGRGVYKVEARNRMIGLQVGGELAHEFNSWASIGMKGKAGLLLNFANQTTEVLNHGPAPGVATIINTFHEKVEDEQLAGMLDVGFFATFHPTAHVDVRIGYDALLVSGLALGLDQNKTQRGSRAVPSASLNTDNSMLYHGPSIGLTFKW
jgi:hypothetical protein